MKTKKLNIPYEGEGFNAVVVASLPKEAFVADELTKRFQHIPAGKRKGVLERLHDLCTDECKKNNIELTEFPAPKVEAQETPPEDPPPLDPPGSKVKKKEQQ